MFSFRYPHATFLLLLLHDKTLKFTLYKNNHISIYFCELTNLIIVIRICKPISIVSRNSVPSLWNVFASLFCNPENPAQPNITISESSFLIFSRCIISAICWKFSGLCKSRTCKSVDTVPFHKFLLTVFPVKNF